MFKPLLSAATFAATLAATLPLHAAELTAQEKRWLHAAA